ncbi:MAG: hypothetical protein M3507_06165 [Actinomycetota bacterium]|nr:hypothetical protein [Actinomycetota bacterium]
MSPRIAVELTSERPDGSWTWRAAGARQPKGVLDGKLLPPGAGIGDVLRAEAEIDIEGITVTTVLPTKGERREPERLPIVGSPGEEAVDTTQPIERGRRTWTPSGRSVVRPERSERPDRPDRSGGRPGGGRPEGAKPSGGRPAGPARPRPDGEDRDRQRPTRPRPDGKAPEGTGDADRRERRPRPPRPELAPRPKAKKLRPRRIHREALLAQLPPEQQPIAEQALRGGMPAVRTALLEQNAEARREGKPEAPTTAVLAIAEALLPRVRVADWLDRADAALADVEELALADLRSVVVSANDVAREEQTREPAAQLRAVLERRTEVEQASWQRDLEASLQSGRVVRALRLSSRSPQPGERLAPEVATRLADAAGAAMTADIAADRWSTLLDAVAYSAVRRSVTPAGVPAEPGEELLAQVRKHAGRVPAIAKLFGIDAPPAQPGRRTPRRRSPGLDAVRTAGTPGTPVGASPGPRPRRIPPPPTTAAPGAEAGPAPGPEDNEAPAEPHASPTPHETDTTTPETDTTTPETPSPSAPQEERQS